MKVTDILIASVFLASCLPIGARDDSAATGDTTGLKLIEADPASPFSPDWPGSIAICSLMFDERPAYVLEFIRYHRWAGVDVLYLRENAEEGANPAIEKALQPYIDAGIVDFGYRPGERHPEQTNWMNECTREFRHKHSWFSYTDLDEFVLVLDKQEAATERFALRDELRRSFRLAGAVAMQWILFGSAGHKQPPEEGQMRGFNRCTGKLAPQLKCIGNQYFLREEGAFRGKEVHQCSLKPGNHAMIADGTPAQMVAKHWVPHDAENEFGSVWTYSMHFPEPARSDLHEVVSSDGRQIVMFHYVTRSQSEFVERKLTHSNLGTYAAEFLDVVSTKADARAPAEHPKLDRLYRRFEREHGFDGAEDVCTQAERIAAAMDAAHAEWG